MAMQQAKGSIFSKFGARAANAFKAHSTDEVEVKNFGDLPPGITGKARLVDIKFDIVKAEEGKTDKKHVGEYFFYAAGVVLDPVVFTDDKGNKIKCAGKRTNVTEMICDTPEKTGKTSRKTVEEHLKWVMHLCRRTLGARFKSEDPQELENWVAAINQAVKSKASPLNIYFDFHTWAGDPPTTGPNKGKVYVNHFWDDQDPGYIPENTAVTGVQDDSATSTDEEDEEAAAPVQEEEEGADETEADEEEAPKPAVKPKFRTGKTVSANGKSTNSKDEGYTDDDDLLSLAKKADKGDTKAKIKLTTFAKDAGIDKETVKNADNWVEVVNLMLNPKKDEPEDEDEESANEEGEDEPEEEAAEQEEVEVPEVDNVVGYKPLNKEGKPFKTPVECLVLKVSSKNKTVDLQNMANQRVYKGVAWTAITPWQ